MSGGMCGDNDEEDAGSVTYSLTSSEPWRRSGRSVVDKTGLTGVYDADLAWNDSKEGPSLCAAIQEQLGLKLEAQRGPLDVLVIDHIERPTSD